MRQLYLSLSYILAMAAGAGAVQVPHALCYECPEIVVLMYLPIKALDESA